ncbi:type VI secretion protein [Streptomyces sp. LP05-1]|uniref:Type VI secretion protein n=1 Tax=Streptomyces pyxinae TaxID=2970734 RepID=A0ABT2CNF4_9ACTN|nr:type VI secretion protein [Streptomyces sp. LP05-1]MCS0638835.1 type VI secretion protein [Streptomyces sp. LP05-1]
MERTTEQRGGIPDGLLVGLLGFLLGLTLLVWTATGLAGLLTHGAWPDGVAFTHTPVAIRHLVARPHDLAAAWPATPPAQLSGYGLFWGLLIGQLMVLVVLAVFVLGTLARWRAVRTGRHRPAAPAPKSGEPVTGTAPVGQAPPLAAGSAPAPAAVAETAPLPVQAAAPPPADVHAPAAPATAPPPLPAPGPALPGPREAITTRLLYGTGPVRRPTAVRAVLDAEGPVLVVTSDPTVWAETRGPRAKLGPVLVYDPGHLCDTPDRLHWSPTSGCEDARVAADRAAALLTPVRPRARADAAVADTAETLLRCWLHAAAVDGRPVKQVHRWAQHHGAHEPVRILRTHPRATNSLGGLLESALTAHPERREQAAELTVRALSALSSVHIREACAANRSDALALASFARETGTLYVVGEPIEDPRTRPGAMPLLTALVSDVVEHGRRTAAGSPDGRLDPPMSLVLDDIAAVAPLPLLPELLTAGHHQGLPTLALLRSQEQGRARWPDRPLSPLAP